MLSALCKSLVLSPLESVEEFPLMSVDFGSGPWYKTSPSDPDKKPIFPDIAFCEDGQ